MSFKKRPTGDKCVKCLLGNHSQCVAWTCMCTFCVSTVEKQREKAIRLEKYWRNRNLSEATLEFDGSKADSDQEQSGRIKPKTNQDQPYFNKRKYFKKSDDFYDDFLV